MTKILSIVLLLVSNCVSANTLTVKTSSVHCTGLDKHKRYIYKAGLVVENISKAELTLITKSDRMTSLNYEIPELTFSKGEMRAGNMLIIPPENELGLVKLYPGEGAQIYGDYKSLTPLPEKAILSYQGRKINNGRYNNWEGIIKSSPTIVTNSKLCTKQ